MKLLLHTCCAPCSSAIIERLLQEGIKPTIYYCNPNIFPLEEYLKRKDECTRWAAECGIDMVDADYSHETWLQCITGLEDQPERGLRCSACFRHRLLSSAQYASTHGFDTLATTLASSRWKNLDQINQAGTWAVQTVNASNEATLALGATFGTAAAAEDVVKPVEFTTVQWWDRNWRKDGLQERRNQLIKEKNFYNQLYCGCEFSIR